MSIAVLKSLKHFDWRMGVTCVDQIDQSRRGDYFVQLNFKLANSETGKDETLFLELPLQQFYQFVIELKKAKSAIE